MYHMFVWWYTPSSPPPGGRPCRDWGYSKMKMKITIQIPTNENPRIDVAHVFCSIGNPFSPPAPSPGPGAPLQGLGVPSNEKEDYF